MVILHVNNHGLYNVDMNTIDSLIQYFGSQRKLASVAPSPSRLSRWPTQASASSASSRTACPVSIRRLFSLREPPTLTGRSCAAPPNPKKPRDPMHHEKLTEAVDGETV